MPSCPNCRSTVTDRYCAHCGQRQGELRPTLLDWLRETLDNLLFVDGRLPRTLLALVRPGRLTTAWLEGRRASYLGPLKLYLFAATAFFLTYPPTQNAYVVQTVRSTLGGVEAGLSDGGGEPWALEDVDAGTARLAGLMPRLVLTLFVPVFAFLVFLLPLRKPRRYAEALVFGFHCWTFAFVLLLLLGLAARLLGVGSTWLEPVFFAGILGYVVLAIRDAYRQPWPLAIVYATGILILCVLAFVILLALLWIAIGSL